MISGASLLFFLLVGFTAGVPLGRQNGDGYEYDVKHPGGNSRVHVRTGGDGRRNSHPGDYLSEATYLSPHYVEPHYRPNGYGHYPTQYGGPPPHGYAHEKVPVYEERSRHPRPAYGHGPYSGHRFHPQVSQSNIDAGPFYEKPAVYSNPKFVQQASVDESDIGSPKLEQIHVDPEPAYGVQKVEQVASEPDVVEQLHEPQLPLKEDSPVVVPNPPLDQQVLVDEPEGVSVLSQEPVLAQLSEDVPPPKIAAPPIVQQSSVDVPPPGVQYMDDEPVVQQVADDYSPSTLHSAPPKYEFVPFGPPYERISHSTEIVHGPPPGSIKSVAPPQQEHVDVPPPVTKSVVLPHVQQTEEVPFADPPHSVKLPPPGIKTVAQEHLDVELPNEYKDVPHTKNPPVLQSVKLPPPRPVTKSVGPPTSPYVRQPVLTKYPPRPYSVKLPPPAYKSPPYYKPAVGIKAPSPYYKRPSVPSYSVKQPYTNSYYVKSPRVSQPPLSYVPVAKSPVPYSVKRPYLPPPPVSHYPSSHYGNPHLKSPYFKTPVTKTSPISYGVKQPVAINPYPVSPVKGYPGVKSPPLAQSSYGGEPLENPPFYSSVKHPPPASSVKGYPSVKSPPLAQSSYGEEPLLESPPYSSSVKHPEPVAAVKGYPSVKSPPLAQSSYEKPISSSVKNPPPVSAAKGYSGVKSPPLAQVSYEEEPLLESPPITSSVKQPQPVAAVKGYPSVKSPPLAQSSYGDVDPSVQHPPPVSSVKGHPGVKSPPLAQSSYGEEHPVSSSLKHPPPVSSVKDYPVVQSSPLAQPSYSDGPVKKYLPVGHSYDGPKDELELSSSPDDEENSHFQDYPPPSHAFQISPGPKPEPAEAPGPSSPFDKYRQVSHAVRLPVSKPTATPNLFAAVPAPDEDEPKPPPPVSHAVLLPKVSSLRSDALSIGEDQPRQDFPAFPVESAYKYPDPVSAHLSNSFGPRSQSDSPAVRDAKLDIDRASRDIGFSFGDRIPPKSRL